MAAGEGNVDQTELADGQQVDAVLQVPVLGGPGEG